MRITRENLAHESQAAADADVDMAESVDGDDDKTFAAMSVAKTISTVSYLLSRPRVLLPIEFL